MSCMDKVMVGMMINDIQKLRTSTLENNQAIRNAGQHVAYVKVDAYANDAAMKRFSYQTDKDLTKRIEDALTQLWQAVDQASRAYARTESYMAELSKRSLQGVDGGEG